MFPLWVGFKNGLSGLSGTKKQRRRRRRATTEEEAEFDLRVRMKAKPRGALCRAAPALATGPSEQSTRGNAQGSAAERGRGDRGTSIERRFQLPEGTWSVSLHRSPFGIWERRGRSLSNGGSAPLGFVPPAWDSFSGAKRRQLPLRRSPRSCSLLPRRLSSRAAAALPGLCRRDSGRTGGRWQREVTTCSPHTRALGCCRFRAPLFAGSTCSSCHSALTPDRRTPWPNRLCPSLGLRLSPPPSPPPPPCDYLHRTWLVSPEHF